MKKKRDEPSDHPKCDGGEDNCDERSPRADAESGDEHEKDQTRSNSVNGMIKKLT